MHALDDFTYWHQYADAAQVIGSLATAFSLGVGLTAATLVFYQIKVSRVIQREANALETHRDYLKLCIQYPELSSSEALVRYLKLDSLKGVLQKSLSNEIEKGLWFLSYVLHTCEQLVETTQRDPAWISVAESQLSYHKESIAEVWPAWRQHYGRDLIDIVESRILK